ncbi:TetR/AcrR family transcriptional regulator [Nocardia puris]|uniref:TetR family transcriptional regulator n=1 Tax=Nocardia puris TaxID=208602 RepID=A0A366E115_9NOCA|nr:TetR/AcrR family transcriptional regulator [Nocardia puris]RBO96066.1 TetR family transcriptional regulator [Nocardia puris]
MDSAPPGGMRGATESLISRAFTAGPVAADESDEIRNRLLDAAYEQFSRFGIQRSTMEDVARRANVSRITVYRRFTGKDELVEQVVLRQFRRYFQQFSAEVRQANSLDERIAAGFVSSLRAIRGDPIIAGLVAADPDQFASSMFGDEGRTLAAVRGFVANRLRDEQRAGFVASTLDTERVAEIMVRICASFLTIPSQVVNLDDEDELAEFARLYLVPMVRPRDLSGAAGS